MKQSGKPILVGSVVRNGCLVALAAAVVCNILFTEFFIISITRTRCAMYECEPEDVLSLSPGIGVLSNCRCPNTGMSHN